MITIEYDIAEDDPEHTDVFLLEPASDQVIEPLLKQRTEALSPPDRYRISEFSGGNARIALAFAKTAKRGESLSGLCNRDLFDRLLYQRKPQEQNIEQSAEICALVYSFDAETRDGESIELPVLAGMAGLPVETVYRHVEELRRRGLVQRVVAGGQFCRRQLSTSWRAAVLRRLMWL